MDAFSVKNHKAQSTFCVFTKAAILLQIILKTKYGLPFKYGSISNCRENVLPVKHAFTVIISQSPFWNV